MRIEHVALWTRDLEGLRAFYERDFGATAGPPYHNPKKQFQSCFLSFEGGARIELMHSPHIDEPGKAGTHFGYAHLAVALGSEGGGGRPDGAAACRRLSGARRAAPHRRRLLRERGAGSGRQPHRADGLAC